MSLSRYRRSPLAIALLLVVIVWSAWLLLLGGGAGWRALADHWVVAVTMVAGSFVAGATSEGGGAVAFPVFTKLLAVAPADAKLFALLIQSVGMTAASVTILALKVRVDLQAIFWGSLGGIAGVAISLLAIAPYAPPQEVRMLFTAMQAGFAAVLVMAMLRFDSRTAQARIVNWQARAALLVAGLIGGMVSGLVGSGIDLVVFAVLTLLFRVSEKIATPTSVVLMAINAVSGSVIYVLAAGPPPTTVLGMWAAAIPVVVIGAPVGAWVCSRLRRVTIARALLGLIALEVATTLWLIPLTPTVVATGLGVLLPSVALCWLMAGRQTFDPRQMREPGAAG